MDKAQKLIQAAGSLRASPQSSAALDTAFGVIATAADNAKQVAEEAAQQAAQVASDHPFLTAAIVGGVILAAAPQVATVPLLNAAGFGSQGVIANSIAAGVHSTIGNVAASSSFAVFQSAGAGGAGLAVVNSAAQFAGAGLMGVAAVVKGRR